ncbi:MAG: BolA family transcriptional regulator, partial [Betaproteobacteria bacterium]|nr:BolA family transcriptional regulator [Betaproteobacteria bacterium]
GGHYKITIVAEAFRGLSPLQRHRLVHDALAPLMSREIHALAIKAGTP